MGSFLKGLQELFCHELWILPWVVVSLVEHVLLSLWSCQYKAYWCNPVGALAFALDLSFSHATLLLQDVGIFRSVCWVLPAFMLKTVWEKVARSVVLERPFTDGGTVVVSAANTLMQWMNLFQQSCAFYCSTAQSCAAGEKWYLQKPGLEGSGVSDSCAGGHPKWECHVSHGF